MTKRKLTEPILPRADDKDGNNPFDDLKTLYETSLVSKKAKLTDKPGYVANVPMHVSVDSDISSSSEDSSSDEEQEFSKKDFRRPFAYRLNDQERGVIGKKIYLPDSDEFARRTNKQRIKDFTQIFEDEAMAEAEQTEQRLAINIGLNRMKSISKKRNKALQRAVNETVASNLDVRYFGFFWKPKWYKVNPETKKEVSAKLSEVRRYYQALKRKNPELAKKFLEENEGKLKDETIPPESELRKKSDIDFNRMVPYCEIRELIKNHTNTENLIAELRKRLPNSEIYLAIMDADTQSLRIKDCSVFDYYDEKIAKHKSKHSENPLHILTSGYTVNDDYPMITLAVELDFSVRRAMASIFPLSPYYPEPNFLILIEEDRVTVTESFLKSSKCSDYSSPQESVNLIKHVFKNRHLDPNTSMFFGGRAPSMIEIPERFFCVNKESKYKKQYMGYYNGRHQIVCWNKQDLTNLIGMAQSHVKPKTWIDSIYKVLPKIEVSTVTIQSQEYSVKGKQSIFLKSLLGRLYRSCNPIQIAKYRQQYTQFKEQDGLFNTFSAQLHYVIEHYEEIAPTIIPDKDRKKRGEPRALWAVFDNASSFEQLTEYINLFVDDEELTEKLVLVAKRSGKALRNCLSEHLNLNYIELAESNAHAYFKNLHFYGCEANLTEKLKNFNEKNAEICHQWAVACFEECKELTLVNKEILDILLPDTRVKVETFKKSISKDMVKAYIDIRSSYLEKIDITDENFDIVQFNIIFKKCFSDQVGLYIKHLLEKWQALTPEQLVKEERQLFIDCWKLKNYLSYSIIRKYIKQFFKDLPIMNHQPNPLNTAILNNTLLTQEIKPKIDPQNPLVVKPEMLKKIQPKMYKLLEKKMPDIYGTYPLHWAAICGNKVIIKVLLLSKNNDEETHWYADIDEAADGNILPLHCALQFCITNGADPELIELLCDANIVNKKAKDGRTSLLIAITELEDPKPVVKKLCKFGAWPANLQKDLFYLLKKAAFQELENPILAAIKYLNEPIQVVREFITHGADPNDPGVLIKREYEKETEFETYPILEAIRENHKATIDELLQLGVKLTEIFDDDGSPPLFVAMENSPLETMKDLITAGADINECETKHDTSLLHEAVKAGFHHNLSDEGAYNEEALKYLVTCEKIDLGMRDEDGMTPLQVAIESDNAEAALILLKANASEDNLDEDERYRLLSLLRELLGENFDGSSAKESDDSESEEQDEMECENQFNL